MTRNEIVALMVAELEKANAKFSQFNSRHEGYAVIKEEVDELWDEIKKKHPDKHRMLEEAIQVGAMAMKFIQLLEGAESDEWKPTPETEAKCRACRYTVMTGEELQALGGDDPCDTCSGLSNWKPKECPESLSEYRRLTRRDENSIWVGITKFYLSDSNLGRALSLLAVYEDIGSPEEFKNLKNATGAIINTEELER